MERKTRLILAGRKSSRQLQLGNLKGAVAFMLWFALASVCGTVAAQGFKGATPAIKAGNWTVFRSLDPITDKVTCTGLLKGELKAQLVANSLFIPVSGGMQSVQLRFGEGAANQTRMPQEMEKKVRALILEGSEFYSAW